jgi:hypothetical protein
MGACWYSKGAAGKDVVMQLSRGFQRATVVESKFVAATPERVFAELADAWAYTGWVVGASHIRDVDGAWPAVGARLYHRVGPWPLSIDDSTVVVESERPRRLVLQARAWPLGEARVELTMDPKPGGCVITMSETSTHGPGRWLQNPLQERLLRLRNRESLARLATIAEKRPLPPDFG